MRIPILQVRGFVRTHVRITGMHRNTCTYHEIKDDLFQMEKETLVFVIRLHGWVGQHTRSAQDGVDNESAQQLLHNTGHSICSRDNCIMLLIN